MRLGAHRGHGFSLIEILVVLVILAVLAATLTIAVASAGGERALAQEAERTQALITYACEQAELSGREIGLSVSNGGYRFSRLDHDSWLLFRDSELRPRAWPANIEVLLVRDGHRLPLTKEFPEKPQLACFSSGELTAFRLELTLPDLDRHYRLDGSADGKIALATVDQRAR